MPCHCHTKEGKEVNSKLRPDEPCTMCAYKHINMALSAWGEFTYEQDNRDFAAGHLRLCVEHLKTEHRDIALEVRDIAVKIELALDADRNDVRNGMMSIKTKIRGLLFNDHPEIRYRLERLSDG